MNPDMFLSMGYLPCAGFVVFPQPPGPAALAASAMAGDAALETADAAAYYSFLMGNHDRPRRPHDWSPRGRHPLRRGQYLLM